MANTNIENPIVGQKFQASVKRIMSAYFSQQFNKEAIIPMIFSMTSILSGNIQLKIDWLQAEHALKNK